MSVASPLWGAPRIHGDLLKLGIEVSQATVAEFMVRQRKPPSQTWRTLLINHVKELVSGDSFVVPTLSFRVLFVFIVLAHHRRGYFISTRIQRLKGPSPSHSVALKAVERQRKMNKAVQPGICSFGVNNPVQFHVMLRTSA